MPARRVEAEHRPDAAGDPAGDRHLLLVAAGQPADLALRPACRSGAVSIAPSTFVALLADVDQAPARGCAAENGRAMFSRTERCISRASARSAGT